MKYRYLFLIRMALFLFFLSGYGLYAQNRNITGAVTDERGEPVIGATVKVKSSNTLGTVTDMEGNFALDAIPSNAVLVISYVGYETTEVAVQGRTDIQVVLKDSSSQLDEIVVIGYSSVRRKDLTGAVGTANVSDMAKAPTTSFADALAGRIAGVSVSSADGQPGATPNIVVRGPGSLTQSVSPLFVIDGFPVEDFDPATLNADDIESISVLKDASSTSIYGSRAANGVILVQTKRGKVGTPVIHFGMSVGTQLGTKKMKLMSPYEFLRYQQERFGDAAIAQYISDKVSLEDYKQVEGLDFQDYVFNKGRVDNYSLSVRGGTEQTRYSVSGSFLNQKGIIVNTGLRKYIGQLSIDQIINKNLRAGFTVGYTGMKSWGQVISATSSNNTSSKVMFRTWAYRPVNYLNATVSLLDADADESAVTNSDYRVNPFIDLENQYSPNYTNIFNGQGSLTYNITDELTLKLTGGTRRNNYRNERFYNSKTVQGSPHNPNNRNGIYGSIRNIYRNDLMTDNTLTYRKTFAKTHDLTALLLMSMQHSETKTNGYSSRLLPNESMGIAGLDQGTPFDPVSTHTSNARASYGGRVDYGYMSKYLLTLSFRADGSSKFPANNKWGYFPGAALAWNAKNEAFLKKVTPISNLKLRSSYGVVGNDRVSDFASLAVLAYALSGYSYNNQTPESMVYQSDMENINLTWERTVSEDIGLELGLFNNRIEFIADLYKRKTNNLLLKATLPPSSGFGTAYKNIGELENRGLEITVNTVNFKNKSFKWESSFNISFNKNKILALNDGQLSLKNAVQTDNNYTDYLYISEIGGPSGMMIGYIWEGNYQYADFDNPAPDVYILKDNVPTNGNPRTSIKPGDIKYRDLNGDGIVNTSDKTIIGRGQPIHTGGFNNNLQYGNFTLNVFFQWAYGADIYNANRITFEGNTNGRYNMNQFASYINRWSPENQTNENFRAGGQGPIGYHSSKYVEDGSFLRLKTVSLYYAVPARFLKRFHIKGLSLNVAMQNLYTWSKYSGLDPEVSTQSNILTPNYDYSAYPQAITIVGGIKLTL